MPRKTHKQMTQEKKPLLYARKVNVLDDKLDNKLKALAQELINKKGNDNYGNKK